MWMGNKTFVVVAVGVLVSARIGLPFLHPLTVGFRDSSFALHGQINNSIQNVQGFHRSEANVLTMSDLVKRKRFALAVGRIELCFDVMRETFLDLDF